MKKNLSFSKPTTLLIFFVTMLCFSSKLYSQATIKIPKDSIKVILGGCYDSTNGMMRDDLRALGMIPSTTPYYSSPYNYVKVVNLLDESTTQQILNFSANPNESIVDWVYIRLYKTINDTFHFVEGRSALVQRDGKVVSEDRADLYFYSASPGLYYIQINHRNHLSIMTAAPYYISLNGMNSLDMSSEPLYQKNDPITMLNPPADLIGGVQVMWPGNANIDHGVIYNSSIPGHQDKDAILEIVGYGTQSNIAHGYRPEDVNMDGDIKYNGYNSDKDVIKFAVLKKGVGSNNKIFAHAPN